VPELWFAFSAGLAGSVHCLGMCGGIVSALALSKQEAGAVERTFFSLLYHLGRISTYTLLGLIAGAAAGYGTLTSIKPVLSWLFLAANLFVVAVGICTATGIRAMGISALDGVGWKFFQRLFARISENPAPLAAVPAGLLMGLIPCGLVYGVLVTAATSGSVFGGGSIMLAFGCGTLPTLLAYGQIAATIAAVGHGLFQRIMGLAVALLGLSGTWKALHTLGYLSWATK